MFSFYRPLGRSHTRTSSSKVGVGKPKTKSGNKVVTVRAAAAATTTTRVVAVIVRSGNDRGKHEQDRFEKQIRGILVQKIIQCRQIFVEWAGTERWENVLEVTYCSNKQQVQPLQNIVWCSLDVIKSLKGFWDLAKCHITNTDIVFILHVWVCKTFEPFKVKSVIGQMPFLLPSNSIKIHQNTSGQQ